MSYYTVVFRVSDQKAFAPAVTGMVEDMQDKQPWQAGAKIVSMGWQNPQDLERYCDYLWSCIEQGSRLGQGCALSEDEWRANGSPEKHDLKADYRYFD